MFQVRGTLADIPGLTVKRNGAATGTQPINLNVHDSKFPPESWCTANTMCEWSGTKPQVRYCACPLSSLTCSIALHTSLIKFKIKDKMIENFKMAMAEHYTKHGAQLSTGPYMTSPGWIHMKPALEE